MKEVLWMEPVPFVHGKYKAENDKKYIFIK